MQSELEKGILRYVDSSIENAPNTIVPTGIIVESTDDGYTVRVGSIEYTNVPTLSATSHVANDTVKVCIPSGQYSNMFILGKLKLV